MKNSRPILIPRALLVLSLIVGFVLAAGAALLSTISTRDVAVAGIRTLNTQDTLLEINRLLASLVDAETGRLAYALTGENARLETSTRASARLDEQLTRLNRRLEDSPVQQAALQRISRIVADREMSRAIDDSGARMEKMNALRGAVYELEQHERTQLALLSASVTRRAGIFQRMSLGMLIAACVLGGAGALLLMRRVNELEAMITVCAWTKRVKFNGSWVSFEEYLRARFHLQFTHGISEEAAVQLRMETAELVKSNSYKFPSASTSPIPDATVHYPSVKAA